MKISVLVATRDRHRLLPGCLGSLQKNLRLPDEIVIMDQSRDEATGTVVKEFQSRTRIPVIYRRVPPEGKSAALNQAVEICSGDMLAFTDDDALADPAWLKRLEGLIAGYPRAAAFCGQVLPEAGTDPGGYINLVVQEKPYWIEGRFNPLHSGFCGANIFVRKSALRDVGGFNEWFGPGAFFRNNNDGELAWRLARAGYAILYSPDLVVYHTGWRDEADNLRLKINYAFALGAFAACYLKHGDGIPFGYFILNFLQKTRRLILGLVLWQKPRVTDGWLHLKGFAEGFWKGGTTSVPKDFSRS